MTANRLAASAVLDFLVESGVGVSLWVDSDTDGWYVAVSETPDRLPPVKDLVVNNVRVRVDSTQPALRP